MNVALALVVVCIFAVVVGVSVLALLTHCPPDDDDPYEEEETS